MKSILLASALLMAMASCTVEKRLYNRGWNVQWRNHHKIGTGTSVVEKSAQVEYQAEEVSLAEESRGINHSEKATEELSIDFVKEGTIETRTPTSNDCEPSETSQKEVQFFQESKNVHAGGINTDQTEKQRKTGVALIVIGVFLFLGIIWVPLISLGFSSTLVDGLMIVALSFLLLVFGWILVVVGRSIVKKSEKVIS